MFTKFRFSASIYLESLTKKLDPRLRGMLRKTECTQCESADTSVVLPQTSKFINLKMISFSNNIQLLE